jgi:crotonobetainyl-CoA:carnitine CoA-transferase CaiB-like acyl-CoA transferase
MEGRRDHAEEVIATLQDRFGSGSREEWGRRLDAAGVWWAKVQHAHELADDEQAHAAGGFVDVPVSDGTLARMVASPVDFSGCSRFNDRPTPELGQDTELVLLERGWDWERIEALKRAGAII